MLSQHRPGTLGVHYPELPDVSWYIPTRRDEIMGLGSFSIDDARRYMKDQGIDFTDYSSFAGLGQEAPQAPAPVSPLNAQELVRQGLTHTQLKSSITISVTLAATSILALVYFFRAQSQESNPIWKVVGLTAMTGAGLAAIEGVSGVLAHFAAKK